MILIAFDGKFHEKKDEIPPRASVAILAQAILLDFAKASAPHDVR